MTTPRTPLEAARSAAEALRTLNHTTRPETTDLDVTDVYDTLAELALMATRLPQALTQLDVVLDQLVKDEQIVIVDGEHHGDPTAVAAEVSHRLDLARAAAGDLATTLDQAQQTLTWAARASS